MARRYNDHPRTKPWRAAFHEATGEVFLGCFETKEQAEEAEQDYRDAR